MLTRPADRLPSGVLLSNTPPAPAGVGPCLAWSAAGCDHFASLDPPPLPPPQPEPPKPHKPPPPPPAPPLALTKGDEQSPPPPPLPPLPPQTLSAKSPASVTHELDEAVTASGDAVKDSLNKASAPSPPLLPHPGVDAH